MSNVIRFLEEMGRNPAVARMAAGEYAATMAAFDIDQPQRQALLDRDPMALNGLLDGRLQMMFMVSTPNPDDHEAIPDDDTDGDGMPDADEPPYEK